MGLPCLARACCGDKFGRMLLLSNWACCNCAQGAAGSTRVTEGRLGGLQGLGCGASNCDTDQGSLKNPLMGLEMGE